MGRIKINKKAINFAVALIAIGVAIYLLLLPDFKFSSNSVKLEAGSRFDGKSYITKVRNIKIDKIDISHNVDIKKPGKYTAIYTYKNTKKTLTVNVVDTHTPKIIPKESC